MKTEQISIIYPAQRFNHQDASRVYQTALRCWAAKRIVIDMSEVHDATTAAFARLVLLRRALRGSGRDLLLIGLRGRAAVVYEVNRLSAVLPAERGAGRSIRPVIEFPTPDFACIT